MLRHKIKPVRIGCHAQRIGQRLPQPQHVQAHLLQLRLPVGGQSGVLQDHRYQPRAVIWRKAEILPVQIGKVALHCRPLCCIRQGNQNSRSFAVNPEVFRERRRNQHLREPRCNHPGRCRIFFQPVAKALIRKVDERCSPPRFQHIRHLRPFGCGQVGPRRVMATAMQKHHIAGCHTAQIGKQSVKINAPCFRVEIAIFCHFQSQISDDRRMVRPCRVGKPNRGRRAGQFDQLQRLPNGPGATRCRH